MQSFVRLWEALSGGLERLRKGFGRLCDIAVSHRGSGWVWKALGVSGRLWEALASFGRLWKGSEGFGRLWEALGRLWEALKYFRMLWEVLGGFGSHWENLQGFGWFGRLWRL